MSQKPEFALRVECYAGHRGEQIPRRFSFNGRPIEVVEVVDAWLAPDHRYFKVRGADGACYILRHDEAAARWELTMSWASVATPSQSPDRPAPHRPGRSAPLALCQMARFAIWSAM